MNSRIELADAMSFEECFYRFAVSYIAILRLVTHEHFYAFNKADRKMQEKDESSACK
jgi:hypothetical protein